MQEFEPKYEGPLDIKHLRLTTENEEELQKAEDVMKNIAFIGSNVDDSSDFDKSSNK